MPRATGVAGELTGALPLVSLAALLSACALVQRSPAPEPGRESPLNSAQASRFADSVLHLMTLDEKLGQLAQSPGRGTQTGPRVPEGGEQQIRAGRVGSFLGIFGAEYTR
ncbi:MAG TPA: hypothetical protein VK529_11385, partial [Gemmatimonadaceae bacterium]|nr:hypothetical protein [Gemmatimonadaceae bacterium]